MFGFQNEHEAAQTSVFVATDPNLDEVTGLFFCDCQVIFLTINISNELLLGVTFPLGSIELIHDI